MHPGLLILPVCYLPIIPVRTSRVEGRGENLMLALPTWSLALLVAASPIMAQTMNVAQRLGYPANAKLLILHADDLGVAHSVNVASLDALAAHLNRLEGA